MDNWMDRGQRQATARTEYEHIMTTPSPDPSSAYIDAGVIGYVFGEMWRRGILTPRDRRWITLSCVGAMDSAHPIDAHVWAALNSGDISFEEFDEFVLHFATQLGWPKASMLAVQSSLAMARLSEQRGEQMPPIAFDPWSDPLPAEERHARGCASYEGVHGSPPPGGETAFRRDAYIGFLYGEIWSRDRYLTPRDRRIITVCCCAAVGATAETRDHLGAALLEHELTFDELQELVVHFAVYVGWALGRQLDDLVLEVREEFEES